MAIKGELRKDSIERFMSKIVFIPFHTCHEWTAARNEKGYGVFGVGKETDKASRIAWRIFKGKIPNGMFVCHKCDNPGCVNPNHLFLGKNQDNVNDMISKKRNSSPPNMGGWNKKSLCQEAIDQLGKKPDYRIALEFGYNKKSISLYRRSLGIKSYAEQSGSTGKFTVGMPHPRWSKKIGG